MVQTAVQAPAADPRPPLWHDPTFHGMNFTQFFGAFNDNLFKQLVLLICVNYAGSGHDYQTYAQALFALPFVLFSGFAGFLADRVSKQRIVVSMKIAEIAVMTAGFLAFESTYGRLVWLMCVVFLMGTHSAFFGPSKYGILPELFRETDLPPVNGMIQMTTFLAIICGAALAGFIKEWFGTRLWVGSAMCIAIAIIGTLTSLLVRRTPVARPGLPFTPGALFISGETWQMFRKDRPLFHVLLISSLFWFLGGVIQPAVNAFGKLQLEYGDARTSVMVVCMAIGIMFGCVWAGTASKGQIRIGFVTLGAWGIVASLSLLAVLGATKGSMAGVDQPASDTATTVVDTSSSVRSSEANRATHEAESFGSVLVPKDPFEWISRGLLVGVGLFAGFFYVPLAVFMQVRPPADLKGRMIGAMNLINWIGILVAAVFYGAAEAVCDHVLHVRLSWIFAVAALVMLPVALFYRPNMQMPAQATGST
jgi:acyl-[acyl-carrier-protein]-phospholipid O-acyltransferase/long-chain-fatty-acid--[acyl-carrier-protein] ligase